jgi:hypothetical protein
MSGGSWLPPVGFDFEAAGESATDWTEEAGRPDERGHSWVCTGAHRAGTKPPLLQNLTCRPVPNIRGAMGMHCRAPLAPAIP